MNRKSVKKKISTQSRPARRRTNLDMLRRCGEQLDRSSWIFRMTGKQSPKWRCWRRKWTKKSIILFISFIIPSATKELRRITSFRVVPWKNTGGPVTKMLYAVSDTQSCFNAPIIRKVFKRSIFVRKLEIEDVGPTRQSYCEDRLAFHP